MDRLRGIGIVTLLVITGCASHFEKGNEALSKGESNAALQEYTASIDAKEPDQATAFYKRGVLQLKAGKEQDARSDYENAIKIKPDLCKDTEFCGFYYDRAMSKARKGDDPGAMSDYNEAIRLNRELSSKPDFSGFYYERAIEKIKSGEDDAAFSDHATGRRIRPDAAKDAAFGEAFLPRGTPKTGQRGTPENRPTMRAVPGR